MTSSRRDRRTAQAPEPGPGRAAGRRYGFLALAPLALVLTVAALAVAGRDVQGVDVVAAAVIALWAAAGTVVGLRRHDPTAPIVLGGAVTLAVAFLASSATRYASLDSTALLAADWALRCALALLPALVLHLLAALPDGRLRSRARRTTVGTGYVVALVLGAALLADRHTVLRWPLAAAWVVAGTLGVLFAGPRYRAAGATDRRRMQWLGLGLAVSAEAAIVVAALRLLVGWPDHWGDVLFALTGLVPLAILVGASQRLLFRVDRVLTDVVALAGLTGLVLAVYVVVVLGLGPAPDSSERSLLLLSMVAAGLTALLYPPAKRWLTERANRIVYGERVAPDEALRTFGQRLTRSIPLDELLLQLVESLRKSLGLAAAAVWTGSDGLYELAASVPHRAAPVAARRAAGARGRRPSRGQRTILGVGVAARHRRWAR